jgi:hypothetical protein
MYIESNPVVLALWIVVFGYSCSWAEEAGDPLSSSPYESFSHLPGGTDYTSPGSPYSSFSKLPAPQEDEDFYYQDDYYNTPYSWYTSPGWTYSTYRNPNCHRNPNYESSASFNHRPSRESHESNRPKNSGGDGKRVDQGQGNTRQHGRGYEEGKGGY